MKECFKCHKTKVLEDFYKHSQTADGYLNKCKSCNKMDVRRNYRERLDQYRSYDVKRQRDSFTRIFTHRYNQIKARSTPGYAASDSRQYYVTGLDISPREDFFSWCYDAENLKVFFSIWVKWVQSGYHPRYVPSIDRVDSRRGYTTDNMQWLSRSDNSKKGSSERVLAEAF